MKRPRPSAGTSAVAPADAPLAKVTVHFTSLPPESRSRLDDAIRGWADWHLDKFLSGYVPPQTVTGTLSYEPATMHLAWEDKPEAPAQGAADTLWFNVKYEQAGGVPQYDRLTDDQLRYSHKKKRPADSLLLVPGQAAAADNGGDAGKPAKRLRGSFRCFNCGSYGHSMRECWKELNRELVEERKREQAAANGGAAYRSGPPRYFLEGAAGGGGGGSKGGSKGGKRLEQVEGEFEGLQPGLLTQELRQVLGIGPTAPPPWLRRMRELGPPPGYMVPVPVSAPPPTKQPARQQEQATAATVAAADPAPRAAAAAGEAVGEESHAESALEDFIPLGGESSFSTAAIGPPAAPPAAAQGSHLAPPTAAAPAPAAAVVAAAPPLEDFIALAGGSGDSPEDAAPVQLECRVSFPGINAPAPETAGTDPAWSAMLEPAPLPIVPGETHPAVPPGFGTPLHDSAPAGSQAALRAGQHSVQVQQPWERRLGDSCGRGGVGGWNGRLQGLHPLPNGGTPASAAAAQPPPPNYSDPQQQRFTPPQSHAGRAYTPDLYEHQQPAPPPPPPQQQQQQQAIGGWPAHAAPSPVQAAAQQNRWLPPEPSQQHAHGAYQQQLQSYHDQRLQASYRQQQQQQQAGEVYAVSRADPGHMLVFGRFAQHAAAAPQAAYAQQQPQMQQMQMQQMQQMQYWAQQQLQQSAQHLHLQQQHPAYGQPPLPAEEPEPARGWDGGTARSEYEQHLWMSDGR
ncbi:hypothetical protein D9Q98_009061 [Chlorella vulgaris]|uniref:CCHC-type domain-containing protein n=1 Tax=Chlorella vulgaris TaxID=3077 RepID=A0A9D4TH57_CHLVU|nr:hypothetical protein D9Q98_009061 [Chlorella vulgaris]